ncbi:hypothetical protein JCM16358_15080 [Halanaerocella petrolearia]
MKLEFVFAKVLETVAKGNVSSVSGALSYQPEVPEALKEE